jgi:hypothetical protein
MMDGFGPIDEMLGILLETWDHRYAFDVDRERQLALFTRGGMQAGAGVVQGGLIRVAYESAPHEVVEEFCTSPAQAAALLSVAQRTEVFWPYNGSWIPNRSPGWISGSGGACRPCG